MGTGEQNVLWFDISMDHVLTVGIGQSLGHLAGDIKRLLDRKLPLPVHPSPQRLALDVRHDIVEQPAGFARVMQRQDIGVLEPGGNLDLAEKTVGTEGVRELGPEGLEGDQTVMPQVPS